MRALALRAFSFSRDGVTSIQAEPGETVDVPDSLYDGLVAEGWIGEAPADVPPTVQEPAPIAQAPSHEPAPTSPPRGRRRAT